MSGFEVWEGKNMVQITKGFIFLMSTVLIMSVNLYLLISVIQSGRSFVPGNVGLSQLRTLINDIDNDIDYINTYKTIMYHGEGYSEFGTSFSLPITEGGFDELKDYAEFRQRIFDFQGINGTVEVNDTLRFTNGIYFDYDEAEQSGKLVTPIPTRDYSGLKIEIYCPNEEASDIDWGVGPPCTDTGTCRSPRKQITFSYSDRENYYYNSKCCVIGAGNDIVVTYPESILSVVLIVPEAGGSTWKTEIDVGGEDLNCFVNMTGIVSYHVDTESEFGTILTVYRDGTEYTTLIN